MIALPVLADGPQLKWSDLPPLPPAPGETIQRGLAAPFVGVSNGALIVGGGANFPDAPPWAGGKKKWWDTIYVMENPEAGWITGEGFRLPRPIAYGQSFTTPYGVVCAGGSDATHCSTDVYLLRWNRGDRKVEVVNLPPLPESTSLAGNGECDGWLYLVGGQPAADRPDSTRHGYKLDFRQGPAADLAWKRLPDLPGVDRLLPVAFGLSDGLHPGFYIFSGRRILAGGVPEFPRDGFRYDPASDRWTQLKDIKTLMTGGTALAFGGGTALVFGGDTGEIFVRKEALTSRMRELGSRVTAEPQAAAELAAAHAAERVLLENHPGFSRQAFCYDSTSDAWSAMEPMPEWPPVTTTAIWWRGEIVLPNGEIRPAVRTPKVLSAKVVVN